MYSLGETVGKPERFRESDESEESKRQLRNRSLATFPTSHFIVSEFVVYSTTRLQAMEYTLASTV